jgi:hypothetical protein
VYPIGRKLKTEIPASPSKRRIFVNGQTNYRCEKKLPKSDFVEKSTRKYPIPDAAHARDALARSSGKPEHASVVAAVKRTFPKIKMTNAKQ